MTYKTQYNANATQVIVILCYSGNNDKKNNLSKFSAGIIFHPHLVESVGIDPMDQEAAWAWLPFCLH
jgi:hypothetical protein